ncbi:DinB family protein [Paenibacillus validus]|uniref:DinB family protein n=1 Tax=Paenibacillus validus TaxID=44253 RepID=UPI003D2D1B14
MITIKTHLERMFDHVHWANLRILAALQASDGKPDKAVRLFAHILGAENVWLTRMNGEDGGSFPIWPEADLAECGRMAEANRAGYARLFERLNESDLSEETTYRNTKGDVFQTVLADILTHVSMHGSYHRGQVNALLRAEGFEPANTDYITFVR